MTPIAATPELPHMEDFKRWHSQPEVQRVYEGLHVEHLWRVWCAAIAAATKQPPAIKWKDHQTAQLVNAVTAVARDYGQTQQLRARIRDALEPAIAALAPDRASMPEQKERSESALQAMADDAQRLGLDY